MEIGIHSAFLMGILSLVTSSGTLHFDPYKGMYRARYSLIAGIVIVSILTILFFNYKVLLQEEFLLSSSIFRVEEGEYAFFFENRVQGWIEGFTFSTNPPDIPFAKLYGLRQIELIPYYQAFYSPLFDSLTVLNTTLFPLTLESELLSDYGYFVSLLFVSYYFTIPFMIGVLLIPLGDMPSHNFIILFWWFSFYFIIRYTLKYFDFHEYDLISMVVVGSFFCCGIVMSILIYRHKRRQQGPQETSPNKTPQATIGMSLKSTEKKLQKNGVLSLIHNPSAYTGSQ